MAMTDMNSDDWTSLSVVSLITAVETEFGIEIELENIENLTSFSAFMKEIQK